jgi:hypothetical protein
MFELVAIIDCKNEYEISDFLFIDSTVVTFKKTNFSFDLKPDPSRVGVCSSVVGGRFKVVSVLSGALCSSTLNEEKYKDVNGLLVLIKSEIKIKQKTDNEINIFSENSPCLSYSVHQAVLSASEALAHIGDPSDPPGGNKEKTENIFTRLKCIYKAVLGCKCSEFNKSGSKLK